MGRSVVLLLLTVLVSSSLVMVGSVSAQSIPKPSVPEFTLKFTDNSYDVPPRYDFDPYTGKDVIMEPGYHVQEKIVEVIIKNQPFTSYTDANGNVISLYYSIRIKGSFGDYWWYPDNSAYERVDDEGEIVNYKGADLDSDYTLFKYGLVGNNGTRASRHLDISDDGGKADFQVQAFIGYMTCVDDPFVPGIPVYDPTITPHHFVFIGEEGDWSDTQTITIPASQMQSPEPTSSPEATLTPTPYSEPQSTEQTVILGLAITVAVLAVCIGLLLFLIKRK
jgi:hypothetical protein